MEDHTILDDNHNIDNTPNSGLSPLAKSYLQETAKWGKFIAILGFVLLGFILLIFVIMLATGASSLLFSGLGVGRAGAGLGIFMFLYFLFIIAMVAIPNYFLYKFSTLTKSAIIRNDDNELTQAFGNLKSLYKFWGIWMAIILGFYLLAFVFGGLGALLM